tara:strand:+ start:187 stop:552 length:366 start_codon:yes stop_codon:yes gene_type:complete
MNGKIDKKYNPSADYPYFFYDPEGSGFEYFKNKELRDIYANKSIQEYLDDGWNAEVIDVVTGEITGQATMTDVEVKPDDLDDEGMDEGGEYWNGDYEYTCNYEIKPLDFKCSSISKLNKES